MLDDPVPLRPAAGCGAAARGVAGRWCSCSGAPDYAGEFIFAYTRQAWLIFVCAAHRHALPESHPLTDAEWAELEHRREQTALAMVGRPYTRPRPLPGPSGHTRPAG